METIKKNSKFIFSLKIITVLLYLFGATAVIILAFTKEEYELIPLGIILAGAGTIEVLYHYASEHKGGKYIHDFIFALIEIGLGIFFIVGSTFDLSLDTACLIWGIFEIAKAGLELIEKYQEIKVLKYHMIPDVLLTLLTLVFGILLCIHTEEGIKVHLIITSVVFYSYAVILFIRFFFLKLEDKYE